MTQQLDARKAEREQIFVSERSVEIMPTKSTSHCKRKEGPNVGSKSSRYRTAHSRIALEQRVRSIVTPLYKEQSWRIDKSLSLWYTYKPVLTILTAQSQFSPNRRLIQKKKRYKMLCHNNAIYTNKIARSHLICPPQPPLLALLIQRGLRFRRSCIFYPRFSLAAYRIFDVRAQNLSWRYEWTVPDVSLVVVVHLRDFISAEPKQKYSAEPNIPCNSVTQ